MGFNFINLSITIRSENCLKLASLLPLSAAAFSSICRQLCCQQNDRSCTSCNNRFSCAWFGLFSQELSCDAAALKRHQKPPLPFVFRFPTIDTAVQAGAEICCGLIVVGAAIVHAQLLLKGLAALLQHNAFQCESEISAVACRDFQGQVQQSAELSCNQNASISLPSELVITSMDGILENCLWGNSEVCLKFHSPLRLLEDGRPLTRFDFRRFAHSVMRRVSSLSYYYGESELDWDFKELSRSIENVICTEDNFKFFRSQKVQHSGIIGNGTFLGDFSRIGSMLAVGSLVHTGKGASYGMGAYELNTMP